jgi:hypothetical protein
VKSCVTALGALTDRHAAILLLKERDGIEKLDGLGVWHAWRGKQVQDFCGKT